MIDDSDLYHASRRYDPVKAREYYLRTRQLKGRKTGRAERPSSGRRPSSTMGTPKKTSAGRRKALQAEKEALEKRLDRLREVLREAVDAAKRRAGVEPEKKSTSTKEKSKEKPKTAAEKREAAKDAKERYDKEEKKTPLSKDIEVLRGQIADIRKQIQDALEDARRKTKSKSNSTFQTAPKAVDSKQEGDRQNGSRRS